MRFNHEIAIVCTPEKKYGKSMLGNIVFIQIRNSLISISVYWIYTGTAQNFLQPDEREKN